MPIITQKRIYRSDLRSNPGCFYLFGDNALRLGMGGQAAEMRGEPNAVGIRTKHRPNMDNGAFFSDADLFANINMFEEDFQQVRRALVRGQLVILPEDGLGTGLSELPQRAPKTYEALELLLANLRRSFRVPA